MITTMETIAARLKYARNRRGWTQGQLAVASDVSQGTIGNIESGNRQARASLIKIARALGVSYDWLADGIGNPDTANEPIHHVAAEPRAIYLADNPEFPAVRRVKLRLRAGVTGFAVESDDDEAAPIVFRREWFDRNGYQPEKLLAVRVSGNSMEPGLFDGDTVVINTAQTAPVDGAVFAINYEGEPVIKRLVRDGGQWWLSSDNPDQSRHPRKIANGDSLLVGQVVHKQSERI
jgi:phage repressor protein C with HTH and peptisase S24 domain